MAHSNPNINPDVHAPSRPSRASAWTLGMKRTTLTIFGWFGAIAFLIWAVLGIEFDINFFSWNPHWSPQVIGCLLGILALFTCIAFLAKVTMGRVALIVSSIACTLAVVLGLFTVAPEPLGPPGQWFSRTQSSPSWYRCARAAIAVVPMVLWAWAFWRSNRHLKNA